MAKGVKTSNTTAHRKRGILGGINDFQEIDTPNEIQPHLCKCYTHVIRSYCPVAVFQW